MLVRQVYNNKTIFWSRILSYMFYPYFKISNCFRPTYDIKNLDINTILVTEYHRIGDVLIIAPILKSIKARLPDSHLILICNKNAEKLAKNLNIADEIISINVPWTDWDWSIVKWWKVRSFAKSFSNRKIDLAFDFKGDFRNGWFLWLTYPKVSYGYDITGGDYFFTNPIKMNQNLHQLYRAEAMVSEIGCKLIKEKKIRRIFRENGSIVIHVGATDTRRAWPTKNWIQLINMLYKKFKIAVVITYESKELIEKLKMTNLHVEYFQGDLIEFKNWLNMQRCIVCPDSMAGHLAAFIGIPVVSLFGSQIPELTYPITEDKIIIKPNLPCNHQSSHWRLCSECMASIEPKMVYKKICENIK